MDYDTTAISEKLGIHVSVIANYEEEWLAQQENAPEFEKETFIEFLSRSFAECSFLLQAEDGSSNAMQCLEAYDEAYSETFELLTDD
jgi:hypothetical protein